MPLFFQMHAYTTPSNLQCFVLLDLRYLGRCHATSDSFALLRRLSRSSAEVHVLIPPSPSARFGPLSPAFNKLE